MRITKYRTSGASNALRKPEYKSIETGSNRKILARHPAKIEKIIIP
jgi:hypothetical protein